MVPTHLIWSGGDELPTAFSNIDFVFIDLLGRYISGYERDRSNRAKNHRQQPDERFWHRRTRPNCHGDRHDYRE
jgi:hypothetical protein